MSTEDVVVSIVFAACAVLIGCAMYNSYRADVNHRKRMILPRLELWNELWGLPWDSPLYGSIEGSDGPPVERDVPDAVFRILKWGYRSMPTRVEFARRVGIENWMDDDEFIVAVARVGLQAAVDTVNRIDEERPHDPDEIKTLQVRLSRIGYDLHPDGVWGMQTARAFYEEGRSHRV